MPHAHKPPVTSLDVQVLQTAAALENLAVKSYASAARIAAVKDSPALSAFFERTRAQHADHASAFNAASVKAGGRVQHAPDPRYAVPVTRALAGLSDAASVVSLLESLEDVNAQSYTRYASLTAPRLRSVFVSVAIVEAAHRSFLLAALKLLQIGEASLIRTPTDAGDLPGAVGAWCFPHVFYSTAQASAINEGAVR